MLDDTPGCVPGDTSEAYEGATKEHRYTSTACWHAIHDGKPEMHERCRQTCKFCTNSCLCACHRKEN